MLMRLCLAGLCGVGARGALISAYGLRGDQFWDDSPSEPTVGLYLFPFRKEQPLLTDTPMTDAVTGSLELDPRIPRASEIAVAADGGLVTLRGTVESFAQRRAAGQDAEKIEGVYEIDNQLKVNLLGSDKREDDEIRGAALQSLIWDAEVPSDAVDVKVDGGWVTLKGDVSYQYESDAAYDDVASMYGVYGITNEIRVTNP